MRGVHQLLGVRVSDCEPPLGGDVVEALDLKVGQAVVLELGPQRIAERELGGRHSQPQVLQEWADERASRSYDLDNYGGGEGTDETVPDPQLQARINSGTIVLRQVGGVRPVEAQVERGIVHLMCHHGEPSGRVRAATDVEGDTGEHVYNPVARPVDQHQEEYAHWRALGLVTERPVALRLRGTQASGSRRCLATTKLHG
ncbi:hypothetical protein A1Q1_03175 [Trichosporon asahii var. asahii CBS 2479]|uniref:Uncharacterized protein n=1 Tax=Trichosporon asahii var. asahii (strain ATCC 90039 / CBS 2479 / JCM 2466 / KCTC 7840 / NBRC 103889/ NCYC 2677 / UAMH 7654) TaxID=1186058 RepID=J4UAW5_TRIAS|nr:hypothetical protein A1Q1_03175 [Trichosporon asahii var. asahii CBS 2479]EJT47940.1 hypothetical protein A1Q1_03175 [Trichosporon asahii var. asahii CBS 2479]